MNVQETEDDSKAKLLSPCSPALLQDVEGSSIQNQGNHSPDRKREEDLRILAVTYSVLFSRYAIATFLSSFFPTYAEDNNISGTISGLIFAAYPLGITITSAVGTDWMHRLGLKSCLVVGMINTTLFTFLFGATPTLCKRFGFGDQNQQWFFLLFYFLGGLGGAVAETGCIMIANYRFRENSGAISASIGTVCGLVLIIVIMIIMKLGCMAGPPMGGILYDYGAYTGLTAFFFPFLVFSAVPFIILAALPFALGPSFSDEDMSASQQQQQQQQRSEEREQMHNDEELNGVPPNDNDEGKNDDDDDDDGIDANKLGKEEEDDDDDDDDDDDGRGAALMAFFYDPINTVVHNGYDEITARVFDRNGPIDYSSTMVGLVFMVSSISYIVTSIPCGYIMDYYKGCSYVFKGVQAGGLLSLFVCFMMLGPLQLRIFQSAFNNVPSAWIGMLLKGIGSTGNNAVYPDLVIGIRGNDEKVHAMISGVWNAVYAVGWAIGPLYGGAVYQAFGFAGYATINAIIALVCSSMLFLTSIPSVSHYLNKTTTKVYVTSDSLTTAPQGFEPIPAHDPQDNDVDDVDENGYREKGVGRLEGMQEERKRQPNHVQ
eukprot:jgi/Bigna1/90774/estExt_fgenesh1_pg.C_790018